jgi:hypothetical protein
LLAARVATDGQTTRPASNTLRVIKKRGTVYVTDLLQHMESATGLKVIRLCKPAEYRLAAAAGFEISALAVGGL